MPDLPLTARVFPAHLGHLAIYSPSLGTTDETVRDQIVYYFSSSERHTHPEKTNHEATPDEDEENEENEQNTRLRQVGLAQGMVDFAKNFSNGAPVDAVETERSRLVLRELEVGWWILASVTLTQLPSTQQEAATGGEFSSREVAPVQLLVKQLLQAHSVFLLHHAASLQHLYQRVARAEFCSLLDRFWGDFVKSWDVMLHGNPAVDIYRGLKLAAGGELGIGVGEEEWGSGEREVLEDFVWRTEGLADLIVSRFGDAPVESGEAKMSVVGDKAKSRPLLWLGTGEDPRSSDGVVFSGTGAIARQSLESISQWVEAIFTHGNHAYGVGHSPSSRHGRKRRKRGPRASHNSYSGRVSEELHSDLRQKARENQMSSPRIPPPLVPPDRIRSRSAGDATSDKKKGQDEGHDSTAGADNMLKYLSLGYGTAWTLNPKGFVTNTRRGSESSNDTTMNRTKDSKNTKMEGDDDVDVKMSTEEPMNPSFQELDPAPEVSDEEEEPFVQHLEQSIGKFIIGLLGDLENTEFEESNEGGTPAGTHGQSQRAQRIVLRTLTVEMSRPQKSNATARSDSANNTHNSTQSRAPPTSAFSSVDGSHPTLYHKKVQVVVYVHQPFIFVFLFDLHTSNLSIPSFYRDLHHRLGSLQKPLLKSTDPDRIAERIADVMGERPGTISPANSQSSPAIYDIIFDPQQRKVRTSIPNIPVSESLAAEGLTPASSTVTVSGSWYTLGIPVSHSGSSATQSTRSTLIQSPWTRIDALNVHTQILNSWIATRTNTGLEMTVKTARGWWVLWTLVPSKTGGPAKEAFLVRKATENRQVASSARDGRSSGGMWLTRDHGRDVSGSTTASGQTMTPAGVSEGVGVDARKWIDGLLHLNT